ncbi:hypothetical protein CC80DRAFT_177973 [Byssothecium circinans]|uniref:Uncharacterized protein n=1 Tax=Byssothecium circinans TaxID=147558 RepID=A0A6A5THG8_9PLEO|nr:hypothetical protein CC80DRAFT_177973 [Byssothecium circinans]
MNGCASHHGPKRLAAIPPRHNPWTLNGQHMKITSLRRFTVRLQAMVNRLFESVGLCSSTLSQSASSPIASPFHLAPQTFRYRFHTTSTTPRCQVTCSKVSQTTSPSPPRSPGRPTGTRCCELLLCVPCVPGEQAPPSYPRPTSGTRVTLACRNE